MVADLVFAFLLITPGAITVWSFYLFGDLFSTLMVATFFAFLNDSVTPDGGEAAVRARRPRRRRGRRRRQQPLVRARLDLFGRPPVVGVRGRRVGVVIATVARSAGRP